jgi:hypothetical protein
VRSTCLAYTVLFIISVSIKSSQVYLQQNKKKAEAKRKNCHAISYFFSFRHRSCLLGTRLTEEVQIRRSAGKRTTYEESAAGICKATASIAHVGAPLMLQWLASFILPDIAIHGKHHPRLAGLPHNHLILQHCSSQKKPVRYLLSSPRRPWTPTTQRSR